MVTLKINGQTAVPASGQTFSIVRENPYFTKAGSYSFNIKLPLGNAANARIFGAVNRHDVAARRVSFPASLLSGADTVIQGKATVTSITDTDVEVQLLADYSEFNSENYDSVYVDALPLGEVMSFDQVYTRGEADSSYRIPPGNVVMEAEIGHTYGERAADELPLMATAVRPSFTRDGMLAYLRERGYAPVSPVYFLPVRPASVPDGADIALNGFHVEFRAAQGYAHLVPSSPGFYLTPHLPLSALIRGIMSAIGYTVTEISSAIPLDAVVTASASRTHLIAQTLPHWTVCEFIEHVENFAAVRFVFTGKNVAVRPASSCIRFSDAPLRVTDEFATAIGEDTPAARGLSYDMQQDEINVWDKLPDDFLSLCTVVHGVTPSISEGARYRGTLFETALRQHYLYDENGLYTLRPVNTFRSSGEDNPVSLRICPASLATRKVRLELAPDRTDTITIPEISGSGMWREYPQEWWTGSAETDDTHFDLQQAIEGEQEDDMSNPDTLPVVLFGGQSQEVTPVITADGEDRRPWQFPSVYTDFAVYRWLIPYEENQADVCPYSLALVELPGSIGRAHAGGIDVDTTVEYTKYFIAHRCPDVSATFIVRGKRFLCKQITMEISDRGMSRVYKGVFYAMEGEARQ